MPSETTFAKIKYSLAADEVSKFPAQVSEAGAKTIDKFLEEHTVTFKSYAGSGTLKSGEWAVQTKSGETFTLPAATTANQLIAISCGPEATAVKVTTSGGAFIYGDFVNKEATITLASNQHVILQANGANWFILAGEPKREQTYTSKVFTKAEIEAGIELSATREVFVAESSGVSSPSVEGVSVTGSFFVPAGQKLKGSVAGASATLHYLVR